MLITTIQYDMVNHVLIQLEKVADVILNISSATNGQLSQKSYEDLENQTGMKLRYFRSTYLKNIILNITSQPRSYSTAVFPGSNKMDDVIHLLQPILKDLYLLEP